MRMLLLVCGCLMVSLAAGYDQDYCYADEENPYLMFGTKTAYEFVHEKPRNPENVPHCQPVQFWLLSRHGTRYPNKKDIARMEHLPELRDQILRNHEIRKQGRLCERDLENLREWTLHVFPSQAENLANQGYDDMKFMARRFKTQFPALLNRTYHDDLFLFRSTDTQRTKASAKAFSDGLFGSGTYVNIPEPYPNDTLIKGYDICRKWKDEIDNNNQTYEEKRLYEMGTEMNRLLQNVSSRLGFSYSLTYRQLDDMYDICRYEKAWNIRKVSPWCAVFSKEELLVIFNYIYLLEYREDLEDYYQAGYGNDLNIKLGCPPVKDFMDRFRQIEERNPQPAGVFYFSHRPMVQMVLSRLDIAKDEEHLTHSNYNLMKNRRWRTSKISSFSTNLAAVFFKCETGEMHRVMFFIGEKLYNYKGCNVGLCNWSFVKQKFEHIANECSLDFCSSDWNGAKQIHGSSLSLIVVAVFIFHTMIANRM
ncbi:Multiple inositol polyphosphate phosphatase 1 [Blattella germanica]|nr:Multiple inositol polyphosphate phosphatase 1 [Blattella germanica]